MVMKKIAAISRIPMNTDETLRASPALVGRRQIRQPKLAVTGVRQRLLDDRQQSAVSGDEEEDIDQGDHDENRDRGADPEVPVIPVSLVHLVDAGGSDDHDRGQHHELVDGELQAVDVGQVAGAQLHRDREHHRLGKGRSEADNDRGDVEEDREVVVRDGKQHLVPASWTRRGRNISG